MIELLTAIASIPWYNLLIILAIVLSIVAVLPFSLTRFIKKNHPTEIGPMKFDGDEESLINNPQIRDYNFNVIIGFGYIKDEMRYRVQNNGFEKIKNWEEYINEAVNNFDVIVSNYMDINYYTKAIIDRLTLTEQNKIIFDDVKAKYVEMFNNILVVMNEEKENVKELEKELENLKKKTKAAMISDIIRIVTKITITENSTLTRRCMTEVERSINEIMQLYKRHYLKLFKEAVANLAK